MIDGDLVAIDGFDKAAKNPTFFFFSGGCARGEDRKDGDDEERKNGFHGSACWGWVSAQLLALKRFALNESVDEVAGGVLSVFCGS